MVSKELYLVATTIVLRNWLATDGAQYVGEQMYKARWALYLAAMWQILNQYNHLYDTSTLAYTERGTDTPYGPGFAEGDYSGRRMVYANSWHVGATVFALLAWLRNGTPFDADEWDPDA